MRWFSLNNFNMNWMFQPPNLFGVRMLNGSGHPKAVQRSRDFMMDETNTAIPVESGEYAAPCCHESNGCGVCREMEPGKLESVTNFPYPSSNPQVKFPRVSNRICIQIYPKNNPNFKFTVQSLCPKK